MKKQLKRVFAFAAALLTVLSAAVIASPLFMPAYADNTDYWQFVERRAENLTPEVVSGEYQYKYKAAEYYQHITMKH